MKAIFTAVRRFDPDEENRWRDYVQWSGLTQLREVISLDILLCPNAISDLVPEDWEHNVHEDCKLHLFRNAEYVMQRTRNSERVQILALMQNPTEDDLSGFSDSRFQFCGFDLVELWTGISALVNCGGFGKAFAASDLSNCGLITDFSTALKVRERLRVEYPDELHAHCEMWAIWKMSAAKSVSISN